MRLGVRASRSSGDGQCGAAPRVSWAPGYVLFDAARRDEYERRALLWLDDGGATSGSALLLRIACAVRWTAVRSASAMFVPKWLRTTAKFSSTRWMLAAPQTVIRTAGDCFVFETAVYVRLGVPTGRGPPWPRAGTTGIRRPPSTITPIVPPPKYLDLPDRGSSVS